MEYCKRWYLGDVVQTIEMDGADAMNEQCIQACVVELLVDFIDNPIPEGLVEGTDPFNIWIDLALRKVIDIKEDFGFTRAHEDQIKNLAWNYWAVGIRATQFDPSLKNRLIKCSRHWPKNRKIM